MTSSRIHCATQQRLTTKSAEDDDTADVGYFPSANDFVVEMKAKVADEKKKMTWQNAANCSLVAKRLVMLSMVSLVVTSMENLMKRWMHRDFLFLI